MDDAFLLYYLDYATYKELNCWWRSLYWALPSKSYPNTATFLNVAQGYVRNSSQVDSALAALSVLYPDIPSISTPSTHHGRLIATFGTQYARVAALAGDLIIHRGRRLCAQSWVKYGIPVYSYTFAAWPIEALPDYTGITHFTEIQLFFDTYLGNGRQRIFISVVSCWSEFAGQGKSLTALAKLMSRMWISFANDLTPNNRGLKHDSNGHGIPEWSLYAANTSDALDGYGVNYRFDRTENGLAVIEPDTWHAEAVAYLIDDSDNIFGS